MNANCILIIWNWIIYSIRCFEFSGYSILIIWNPPLCVCVCVCVCVSLSLIICKNIRYKKCKWIVCTQIEKKGSIKMVPFLLKLFVGFYFFRNAYYFVPRKDNVFFNVHAKMTDIYFFRWENTSNKRYDGKLHRGNDTHILL